MALLLAGGGCGDDSTRTVEDPARAVCQCRLDTQIANLALCVSPTTSFAPTHVYSTFWNDVGGKAECEPWRSPQPVPAMPWSKVQISSRCQGSGQVCVTVKAGMASSRSAEDCVLTTRCSAFDYTTPDQPLELAPLGAWVAESSECASRYEQLGGYFELTAPSQQLGCGNPDEITYVPICPTFCNTDPNAAGCEVCGGPGIMPSF